MTTKIGLATKFNALIVASILATVLGTGALTVREQITASHRQLLVDGAAVAALVHHTKSVEGTQATFGESADRLDGREYIDLLVPVLGSRKQGESALFTDEGAPGAGGEIIGYVQLGLSQEGMRQRLHAFLVHAAASAATCVLVFVGATIFLTRKITSPIRSLVEATRAVTEGRLDHAIEVDTRDELRELGTSFSAMLGRLREYRKQVESHQATLEQKVEERTHDLGEATKRAVELATEAEAANRAKSQFLANMSHE